MRKVCLHLLLFALISLSAALPARSAEEPVACALVPSEELAQSPPFQILEVQLSQRPELSLLERANVEEIFQEEALQASLSATGGNSRRQLGNLLGARLLVVMRSESKEERKTVQVVIADTKTGLRLANEKVLWKEERPEETARAVQALLDRSLKKMTEEIQMVAAVTPFLSKDLTHRYDAMQEACANIVKQQLAKVKGVFLVEMDEARALTQEFQVVGGSQIQERLQPFYFNGWYENVTENGERKAVRIFLEARLGSAQTFRSDPSDESPNRIANVLAKKVSAFFESSGKEKLSFDPEGEVALLRERARTFRLIGEWGRALSLIEAALLVQPDNPELHLEALEIIPDVVNASFAPYESRSRFLELAEQGLHLEMNGADHILRIIGSSQKVWLHPDGTLTGLFDQAFKRYLAAGQKLRRDFWLTNELLEMGPLVDKRKEETAQQVKAAIASQKERIQPIHAALKPAPTPEWTEEQKLQIKKGALFSQARSLEMGMPKDARDFHMLYRIFVREFQEKPPVPPETQDELARYTRLGELYYLLASKEVEMGEKKDETAFREYRSEMKRYIAVRDLPDETKTQLYAMLEAWPNQEAPQETPKPVPTPEPTATPVPPIMDMEDSFLYAELPEPPRSVLDWTACGQALDALITENALFLYDGKEIRKAYQAPASEGKYHSLYWDGRHIWIPGQDRVLVFSTVGKQIAVFNEANGLPPGKIFLAADQPGRVYAAGGADRAWCAELDLTPDLQTSVRILFTAHLQVSEDGNIQRAFVPLYFFLIGDPDQPETRRLLIGRTSTQPLTSMVIINPGTGESRLSKVPMNSGLDSSWFVRRNGALYWIEEGRTRRETPWQIGVCKGPDWEPAVAFAPEKWVLPFRTPGMHMPIPIVVEDDLFLVVNWRLPLQARPGSMYWELDLGNNRATEIPGNIPLRSVDRYFVKRPRFFQSALHSLVCYGDPTMYPFARGIEPKPETRSASTTQNPDLRKDRRIVEGQEANGSSTPMLTLRLYYKQDYLTGNFKRVQVPSDGHNFTVPPELMPDLLLVCITGVDQTNPALQQEFDGKVMFAPSDSRRQGNFTVPGLRNKWPEKLTFVDVEGNALPHGQVDFMVYPEHAGLSPFRPWPAIELDENGAASIPDFYLPSEVGEPPRLRVYVAHPDYGIAEMIGGIPGHRTTRQKPDTPLIDVPLVKADSMEKVGGVPVQVLDPDSNPVEKAHIFWANGKWISKLRVMGGPTPGETESLSWSARALLTDADGSARFARSGRMHEYYEQHLRIQPPPDSGLAPKEVVVTPGQPCTVQLEFASDEPTKAAEGR
ncbi:hypothetical protein HQ520_16185 [bacterium]|nr:hypothetical protein [bacterium]